jgi:hypothetical protein
MTVRKAIGKWLAAAVGAVRAECALHLRENKTGLAFAAIYLAAVAMAVILA